MTQAVVRVGSKLGLKAAFKELRLEPKLLNRGLRVCLSGVSLYGVCLSGFCLSGVCLSGVCLSGVCLSRVVSLICLSLELVFLELANKLCVNVLFHFLTGI